MLLNLFCSVVAVYVGWSLICMEINYRRAASMGIPLVRLPIDPLNILFQVFESHVWKILDAVPIPLPYFARYARRGWYFTDKARSHLEHGPIWALVTPCDIHILVSDAEAIHSVFSRRNDFLRPHKMYQLLEVYGPSISTASQSEWSRHRKVLATPFNERAMSLVWKETLDQTRQMAASWSSYQDSKEGIPSITRDSRTLSLNVLATAGFRRSFAFRSSIDEDAQPDKITGNFSYRDALQVVLDNVLLLMLLPRQYLVYSWLPASLRRLGKAAADFQTHMTLMLDSEAEALNRGEKGGDSLITSLVKALDMYKKAEAEGTGSKGLSLEDIYGNMFVINFAGHDTTANTLAFVFLLLSANQEVQEWIAEEISQVTNGADISECEYSTTYPQLVRCQAILHETLRLYPPILALPKWTNQYVQTLKLANGRDITIPPNSGISPSVIASHTHPDYWKAPLVWNPKRWVIEPQGNGRETLLTPPRGTYYPWSDGPQMCLGVKFSQVEFVSVLAGLLQKVRLGVIPQDGRESQEMIGKRVHEVVQDCDFQMLLRMKHPEKVRITCRQLV